MLLYCDVVITHFRHSAILNRATIRGRKEKAIDFPSTLQKKIRDEDKIALGRKICLKEVVVNNVNSFCETLFGSKRSKHFNSLIFWGSFSYTFFVTNSTTQGYILAFDVTLVSLYMTRNLNFFLPQWKVLELGSPIPNTSGDWTCATSRIFPEKW